jgi:glycosyltransferase involved in cell wall biosynthesis
MSDEIFVSVVMPCLNEAETLEGCIKAAKIGIEGTGVAGEIIIADNGSTDGSQQIATSLGARVVPVPRKGYGSALLAGIDAAKGRWIIMGDSDGSYDWSRIAPFVEKLKEGYDLVMGCRMPSGGGTVAPGAMPFLNRWLGNPVLSAVGRILFSIPITDFHCGLRAFSKTAYQQMELKTYGMEFASEMVVKAALKGQRITQVPITLHKDGRSRPPHLRRWRDGWRHLRFMLLFSPKWLFFYPGLLACGVGLLFFVPLSFGPFTVGHLRLNNGTLGVAGMMVNLGLQVLGFGLLAKAHTIAKGLHPENPFWTRCFQLFSLEKGIIMGLAPILIALIILLRATFIWKAAGFGMLDINQNLRTIITAAIFFGVGTQIIFTSFFISLLELKTDAPQKALA